MRSGITPTSWSAALGLLVLPAACGPADRSDEASTEVEWRMDSVPTFQVGGHDDRPEYTLYDVVGTTRLSDGRVVIANSGTSQLRIYDGAGTHLLDVGGEGDGPGELRFIFQLVRGAADSLIVFSRDPGLTWYDPRGEYVRSARRDVFGTPNHACRFGEGNNWRVLSNGTLLRLLVDNFTPEYCPPQPQGPWRMSGLLGIPSERGSTFDTIALLPATERVSDKYRVFGHDLLLGFAPDRVYAGDTDSRSILALSYEGDTLASLPAPFGPKPIPDEAKDEGIREVTQPDGSVRFEPGYSDYPNYFPRYGRFVVDSEGYLWVMEYPLATEPFNSWRLARPYGNLVPDGGALWRVLDSTGVVVTELRTPPGFFVMEVGSDYVLGVLRDEYDVETVDLYELRR